MSSEISNNLILNFDIFKHHSNFKDVPIPECAQSLISKLQASIIKIQDETLQKYLSNDAVPKVMVELERSLNSIMKKNLLAVKSIDSSKRIKLGELYNFSVRNNASLKKHLNAIYLTSRVYKTLFKDHPSMDNLKLRLISVRCKAIRDICLNESRRGKIRHLRCTKNPKFIPSIPKKLKSILKKINRELQKYSNKENHFPLSKIDEIENILGKDPTSSWEKVGEMMEEMVVHYYKNIHCDSGSGEEYMKGLMEICQSQNKCGDTAMLNYCDQEMAMEYLMMNCDKIENDFSKCDSLLTLSKSDREVVRKVEEIDSGRIESLLDRPVALSMISEITAAVETCSKKEEVEKEDLDILDFENFQLVDVWEEKNEIQSQDNSDVGKSDIEKRETKSTRRKRRSRFAPLTEEDLAFFQQPRTLGFCSTFVDEDMVVNERQIDLTNLEDSNKHQIIADDEKEKDKASINTKMFDVVANVEMCDVDMVDPSLDAENQENRTEIIVESVPLNKGELCKIMLRKFHDSLKQAIEGAQKKPENWIQFTSMILEPWKTDAPNVSRISGDTQDLSKEIFNNIENKMNVLMRDYLNRSQIKRKLVKLAAATTVVEQQQSPSPTPFDQTIEASMKKTRTNPPVITHPVVVRRPTRSDGQSSPERARLRAMMLSYKRDVEKNREFGDKREEGQLCSSQSSTYDECGMAELISKSQIIERTEPDSMKSDNNVMDKEFAQPDIVLVTEPHQKHGVKKERGISAQLKTQDCVAAVDTDSEGLVTSSDDDEDGNKKHQKPSKLHTSTPKEHKVEKNRMQWLVPPQESITLAPIPAPATPFLDDEPQSWTGRKVFVVDSHDKGSSTAHIVKTFLQKNGARVYDTTNYKQAGKDLHVLVHQDWRFPDSSARIDNAQLSSPISLLLLKNNSGVHFLSYTDLESVSRFSCQTIFPHSRSCIFLDHHALVGTHSDNIRNMLDFMITERQTSNRIWCLKIPCSVYKFFCNKMTMNINDADLENLKSIQTILTNYASKYSKGDSMCLVEIQTDDEDITNQQDHVLNQQYYLQKKFRHFCILTDNLNTTELDIGFLSIYGVAVLPLNTFLTNKTGKYIRKATPV